jgi:hypothetical protein
MLIHSGTQARPEAVRACYTQDCLNMLTRRKQPHRALAIEGIAGQRRRARRREGTPRAPRNDSREFGPIRYALLEHKDPTVLRHRAQPGLIFSQPWQRIARALHTRAHFLP